MTEETLKRLLDENMRMAEVIRGSGIFARVEQIDAVRESILDGLRKGIYHCNRVPLQPGKLGPLAFCAAQFVARKSPAAIPVLAGHRPTFPK